MNFKPTVAKSIVSVLGGAVSGIISKSLIESKLNYCPPGAECLLIYRTANTHALLIGMGVAVLIYVIWSLATKE